MCPVVEKTAEIGTKKAGQTPGFVANRQKRRRRFPRFPERARSAIIAPISGATWERSVHGGAVLINHMNSNLDSPAGCGISDPPICVQGIESDRRICPLGQHTGSPKGKSGFKRGHRT